ncbi:hypothetical protein NHQ30_006438 [Ciborinia camelliae]|nr:hypothetical protein NHQ30_006438 [Ciborinia camelliae]
MAALLLPGETYEEASKRLGFDLTEKPKHLDLMGADEKKARSNAWLRSEPHWRAESRMGPEPAWRGVKVLGEGGNGTAGRWQLLYARPPEGTPGRLPFKTCVVKQQAGRGDMRNEVKLYELLRHVPSPHLVKMYRRLYEDTGLGTVRGDTEGPVYRIYLEDCERGDLEGWIEGHFEENYWFEEWEIWDVFHCLSRGLYALHYGHEQLDHILGADRWERDEIVHFDLKAPNGKPKAPSQF